MMYNYQQPEEYEDYLEQLNNLMKKTNDPTEIITVEDLKIYNKYHGINIRICKHFKTDVDKLTSIMTYCDDYTKIRKVVNNDVLLDKIINKNMKSIEWALSKNEQLVDILSDKRTTFCGIGTNKIKRRLNKLAVNDSLAKMYRIAIEIEDKNIQAKDASYRYKDKIYNEKENYILELIKLFSDYNMIYGYQESDVDIVPTIIYFEIPNCEQISFHCSTSRKNVPKYIGKWDGKINSTLDKLEVGILKTFKDITNG